MKLQNRLEEESNQRLKLQEDVNFSFDLFRYLQKPNEPDVNGQLLIEQKEKPVETQAQDLIPVIPENN